MSALAGVVPADLDIASRTLYGEARGEPLAGQQAVAWVIRNRVENPGWWGNAVRDVCLKPFQFSCWNMRDPNYAKLMAVRPDDPELQALRAVCSDVFSGALADPTGGADHYERLGSGASWAKGREFNVILGSQAFYKLGLSG